MITRLDLQKDDAALVWRADGALEFLLPNDDPDAEVDSRVVILAAIAMRLGNDPTFDQEMIDWMDTKGPCKDDPQEGGCCGGDCQCHG